MVNNRYEYLNFPLVSVIIPIYNANQYIHKCIESVLNQTLQNFEIICINDESTDGSYEIVKEYEKKESRIKVISQKKRNAGVARNVGITQAKGKYIYFLDSDDYIDCNLLSICVDKMEETGAELCVFKARTYSEITRKENIAPYSLVLENCPSKTYFSPVEMKNKIFNSFQNWPWNKFFRREFIINNSLKFQDIDRTNDLVFTNLALAVSNKILIINKELIWYRVDNQSSLQGSYDKNPICFIEAYKLLKKSLEEQGLYELYEISFLNDLLESIYHHMHKMKSEHSFQYLFNIVKYGAEIDFNISKHPRNLYEQNYYEYYKLIVDSENVSLLDNEYAEELNRIKNSVSYRIGRRITFFPRVIRRYISNVSK